MGLRTGTIFPRPFCSKTQMIILGIDATLTRTGFCWWDITPPKSKQPLLNFQYQSFDSYQMRYFHETSRFMVPLLRNTRPDIIVVEEPLPQSFSAGYLWGIFTSLMRDVTHVRFENTTIGTKTVFINPSSHKSFQNIGRRGKSFVTKKAKEVFQCWESISNLTLPLWDRKKEVLSRGGLTHDEADAFFLTLYYLFSFRHTLDLETQNFWLRPLEGLGFKTSADDHLKFKTFPTENILLNFKG